MIEFSEMLLAESLNQVAPFYMTDDTQIPSRITAAFKIDDTDYIFLFEKFLSEGLYKIEIIQMAGKTKRYWKFKNTTHIRIAFATAIKAFEASIPFMGTQVKGIAMPIPATLEKSYVKLAQFLLAKTYLANQFDYLPIDHTKSKFQYLMMVRKGQLAKNIFTAKYFKDYDFSSFDMHTKSMKAASFGVAKDNKQLIPGAAIEKIKPVIPEKPTYTLTASKKFTFKDVEFDDFSGTSEHPVFGVNSKNEKKIIVDLSTGEIADQKKKWEEEQAKKKAAYEEYEKKHKEWNEKFKEYTEQKLKEKGSAELKIELLNKVSGEIPIANSNHTQDEIVEKVAKLMFLAAPGFFTGNYYGSYFDSKEAFGNSGYYKIDIPEFLYSYYYNNSGWSNNNNNVQTKITEVSKHAMDELVSMGLKHTKNDLWDTKRPKEMAGVPLGNAEWTEILYQAGKLAHSQHANLDTYSLSKEFQKIEKKPDHVYYDSYEVFEIPSNTVTKHQTIAEVSYDELEVVDSQKIIKDTKGQGEIDFYKYEPSNVVQSVYQTETYKQLSENFYEKEFQAVYNYTGGDYSDINNGLRKLYNPDMQWTIYDSYLKTASNIKKAFDKLVPLEIPMWVFRNTTVPGVNIPDKTFEVGEIIVDAAFMSTSLSYNVFDGGNTRFMIYIPKGSKVAPILNKSQHSAEREILLPAMSALKVIEVYCVGNKQHVKCIYIGNGMNSFFDSTVTKFLKSKNGLKESKIMKFKEYIMENKDKDKKIGKGIFAPGADNLSSLETLRKGAKDIKSGKIKLDKAPTPTKKS